MAVRGCVTLFFILLSGIVHANDQVTSPLPEMAEPSTSKLPPVMQTPTAPPTTSSATTHAGVTSEAPGITLTSATTTKPTTTTKPPTTTQPPTTTHHNTTNSTTQPPTTTHHNTTNSTTEAPTTAHTNATTAPTAAPTTTTTTPPVPNPTVGNYGVKSDNVTVCLLAKMGLQFSFKISGDASIQTFNLDPNVTEASGTCGGGGNDSSLVLKSKEVTVNFVFTNVSDKFHLHVLAFSIELGNGSIFRDSNNNLSLWEASVGSSYMCKKELSYNISEKLTVNTFELQVQPFAVQKNMFSTAEECFLDSDLSFLVPIAVGVALSFLIILVLISYLIGRRKSRTGYQSV